MNGRPFLMIFFNLSWNYLDCNFCVFFGGLLYFNTTEIYQQYFNNAWLSVVSSDQADVFLTALVKLFCMLKPPSMRNVASLEFLHLRAPWGSIFISAVQSYIFIGFTYLNHNSNCPNVQSGLLSNCVTAKWTEEETEIWGGRSTLRVIARCK